MQDDGQRRAYAHDGQGRKDGRGHFPAHGRGIQVVPGGGDHHRQRRHGEEDVEIALADGDGEEDDNVESPYGELAEQGGIGFAEPDDGRGSEERPREEAEGEVQQIVEGRLEMATSTGGA